MFHFPAFASNPLCIQGSDIFIIANSNRQAAFEDNALPCRDAPSLPTDHCSLKMGFPIRISTDQSLFAAPRSFSQRTTSFIASQRQGIHRMLLRHLIVLMIDVREINSQGHMIRKAIMLAECTRFNGSRWCRTFRMLQDEQLSNTFPLHNDKQQRNHRFR